MGQLVDAKEEEGVIKLLYSDGSVSEYGSINDIKNYFDGKFALKVWNYVLIDEI